MNTKRCALAQLAPRFAKRDRYDDPIKPTIQIIEVLRQRGVLLHLSPSSDGDGTQQKSPEWGAERGIAALDGVGRIAQKMRQAHLPKDAMAALAPQHVGDPYGWLGFSKSAVTTALPRLGWICAAWRACRQNPLPPVLALHPGQCF